MAEVHIRKRTYRNGKVSYEYYFEAASVNGERKRISQSGFATKTEARTAGQKALNDYEHTGMTITKVSDINYADFLSQWLEEDESHTCKEITVENYKKKISLYINPNLVDKRLKNINKLDIRDFLEHMYDEGFSQNTISVCKGIITKSFDYAVDMQFLPFSPAVRIKSLKKAAVHPRNQPHVYITQDRFSEIFKRFPKGTPNHVALMLGYHCGLRLGKTFVLVWEDVDFENKLLKINRQVQWKSDNSRTKNDKLENNGSNAAGNGFWYFSEPKYQSYRIINLDDEILALLQREKAKREKAEPYIQPTFSILRSK